VWFSARAMDIENNISNRTIGVPLLFIEKLRMGCL
jgi:hypothetical protein